MDDSTLKEIHSIMLEKATPGPLTYQIVDEIIFELILDDTPN